MRVLLQDFEDLDSFIEAIEELRGPYRRARHEFLYRGEVGGILVYIYGKGAHFYELTINNIVQHVPYHGLWKKNYYDLLTNRIKWEAQKEHLRNRS